MQFFNLVSYNCSFWINFKTFILIFPVLQDETTIVPSPYSKSCSSFFNPIARGRLLNYKSGHVSTTLNIRDIAQVLPNSQKGKLASLHCHSAVANSFRSMPPSPWETHLKAQSCFHAQTVSPFRPVSLNIYS